VKISIDKWYGFQLKFGMVFNRYIQKLDSLTNRAKTKKEVADEYGICVKTLNDHLRKKNIRQIRGLLFPETLREIYKKLGLPAMVKKDLSENN